MLPAHHLITSIHTHWAAHFPGEIPTLYPGTRLDTDRLAAWCELWVDAWSAPPRRAISPDHLTVSILVHCFARHATDKTAVHQLATAARTALSGQLVPIVDATTENPTTLGALRIREHTVQDLSRNHAALGQERLQHLVLVLDARAVECAEPVS
jgi:hypothetical protein